MTTDGPGATLGTDNTDETDDTADTQQSPGRRRGRRPAGADTRSALLDAAREVFNELGYDRATVREIARRAGVDAAMVNHWFGGKQDLFVAAVQLPINPADIISDVLSGDRSEVGSRLVHRFLRVWDGPNSGQFVALARSAASHEAAARMMREFFGSVVFGRLARELRIDHSAMRGSLCASQIIGLALARYVLRLEPIASAPSEAVAAAIAPTLQRYLTGELDSAWLHL